MLYATLPEKIYLGQNIDTWYPCAPAQVQFAYTALGEKQYYNIFEISGSSHFCSFESYEIPDLPTGATITWTATGSISISGANNINPVTVTKTSDGTGTLTANINTSCDNFSIQKSNIQVGLPKAPSFSFYPSEKCADQYIQITLALPEGTSVTSMTGLNGSFEEPLSGSGGTYTLPPNIFRIYYTLQNSCGSKSFSRLISRTNCSSLTIYPNPTNSLLNIESEGIQEVDKEISLYNNKGTKVKIASIKKGETKTALDTRDLSNGTYFLHIREGKEIIKKQIIIQH